MGAIRRTNVAKEVVRIGDSADGHIETETETETVPSGSRPGKGRGGQAGRYDQIRSVAKSGRVSEFPWGLDLVNGFMENYGNGTYDASTS